MRSAAVKVTGASGTGGTTMSGAAAGREAMVCAGAASTETVTSGTAGTTISWTRLGRWAGSASETGGDGASTATTTAGGSGRLKPAAAPSLGSTACAGAAERLATTIAPASRPAARNRLILELP